VIVLSDDALGHLDCLLNPFNLVEFHSLMGLHDISPALAEISSAVDARPQNRLAVATSNFPVEITIVTTIRIITNKRQQTYPLQTIPRLDTRSIVGNPNLSDHVDG
jgi:hypothetical protein